MSFRFLAAACAAWTLAAAAPPALAAGQLQPARPVSPQLYSGRWYEIARTPNHMQGDCLASTTEFAGFSPTGFSAVQTCHSGSPTGPARTLSVRGRVLPASMNAKIQLEMLGGLISQQYWILDHAQNDAWLIMTTPNDRYVWLMARTPMLTVTARSAATARLRSLGFDLSKMVFEHPVLQQVSG